MKERGGNFNIFTQPELSCDENRIFRHQLYMEFVSWVRQFLYVGIITISVVGLINTLIFNGDNNTFIRIIEIVFSLTLFSAALLIKKHSMRMLKTGITTGKYDYVLFFMILVFSILVTLIRFNNGINDLSIYLIVLLTLIFHLRISMPALILHIMGAQIIILIGLYRGYGLDPGSQLFISYIINTTVFSIIVLVARGALLAIKKRVFLINLKLIEDKMYSGDRTKFLEQENYRLERIYQELKGTMEIDSITGLPNKRKFEYVYDREWMRALRSREPLAIIIVDIDYFGEYNKAHGRSKGDECLNKVAGVIKAAARRTTDLIARYDNDRFYILLPDTDYDGAVIVMESIIRNVKAQDIKTPADVAGGIVTVSAGAAVIRPMKTTDKNILYKLAEEEIKKSKDAGRSTYSINNLL